MEKTPVGVKTNSNFKFGGVFDNVGNGICACIDVEFPIWAQRVERYAFFKPWPWVMLHHAMPF